MTTPIVEKVFAANSYEVYAVSWSGYLTLISDMGIAQLKIYYKLSTESDDDYQLVSKSSYKDTYNSSLNSVDLSACTYNQSGAEQTINLDKTIHDIKLVRSTSHTPFVEFTDGAKLSAEDLTVMDKQAIHLVEELEALAKTDDDTIYTYINTQLALHYTKTEIDGFFNTLTLPNWSSGYDYIVGDTVLHDDPNTEASTLLVWYCAVDHRSSSDDQPSATGGGSSYWTNVAPDTSLDNLSYVRKNPGITGTPLDWNTITPQNTGSLGLKVKSLGDNTDLSSSFILCDAGQTNALQWYPTKTSGASSGALELYNKASLINKGVTNLNEESAGSTTIGLSSYPLAGTPTGFELGLFPWGTRDSLRVYDNAGAEKFTIDYEGSLVHSGNITTNGVTTHIKGQKLLIYDNAAFFGAYLDVENPERIRSNRGMAFGYHGATETDSWTQTIYFKEDTGDITISGDINADNLTTTSAIETPSLNISGVLSADFLKTDSSGNVVAGSGDTELNRVSYNVVGSDTSLTDRQAVYLNNSTELWTTARADNETTLCSGFVDNITGSDGDQTFDIVFVGSITGFTSLEIGNWYWLSDTTAGGITSTRPVGSGDLVDPVGIAVSSTILMVIPARPNKLAVV